MRAVQWQTERDVSYCLQWCRIRITGPESEEEEEEDVAISCSLFSKVRHVLGGVPVSKLSLYHYDQIRNVLPTSRHANHGAYSFTLSAVTLTHNIRPSFHTVKLHFWVCRSAAYQSRSS